MTHNFQKKKKSRSLSTLFTLIGKRIRTIPTLKQLQAELSAANAESDIEKIKRKIHFCPNSNTTVAF